MELQGKRRSINAAMGRGLRPMPFYLEALIPLRIRDTTTGIHTFIVILSVSGGRRTTRKSSGGIISSNGVERLG